MQSTEDCSKLPPQAFVIPQFIPITPESVRSSLRRQQRQKRREQRAKELQKGVNFYKFYLNTYKGNNRTLEGAFSVTF